MRKLFSLVLLGAVLAPIFFSESYAAPRDIKTHDKVSQLPEKSAKENWDRFVRGGIACDYFMRFSISHNPRKGDTVLYAGEIYGKMADSNGIEKIRIVIGKFGSDKIREWLIIHSPTGGEVWTLSDDGRSEKVPRQKWGEPLFEGLIISPFDFMMPFRNWNAKYIGSGRIGQAVHFYEIESPSSDKEMGIFRAKVALTREFNTPAQVRTYSRAENGSVSERVLTLGSVKKIDGLWIMREFELLDITSRDCDVLKFEAAKMRAIFDKNLFDTNSLGVAPEAPLAERL